MNKRYFLSGVRKKSMRRMDFVIWVYNCLQNTCQALKKKVLFQFLKRHHKRMNISVCISVIFNIILCFELKFYPIVFDCNLKKKCTEL